MEIIIQATGIIVFIFLALFFAFGKPSKNAKGKSEFSIAEKFKLSTNSFIMFTVLTLLLIFYPVVILYINIHAPVKPIINTQSGIKNFVLNFTLDPEESQQLISSNDSIVLKYRVHITDKDWKYTPVENQEGQGYRALIDSVNSDDIYAIKLWNVNKNITWSNNEAVSVTHGSAKLTHKTQ